jgi:hypothetical protein
MRPLLIVPLFAVIASIATAAPTPKEQLAAPPADARHYTISSTAGKHGDVWSWRTPDGRVAYRMSMSLRGWVTEDDELRDGGQRSAAHGHRHSRLHRSR